MEELIHNISVALLSQDCKVYVFAPYVRGLDNKSDTPYKVLRYHRPTSRRYGVRQVLLPLLWNHIRYRFDIIHCHGVYPPGYIAASFRRITGTPFVITPHGGDIKVTDNEINGHILSRIRKTFASADAITAISPSVRARVLNLGAPPEKTHIIPNGVFLHKSETGRNDHDESEMPYILYIGRLAKIKGLDILLQAFSIIYSRHPDVRLKIAGDGREKDSLHALANKLGVLGRTDFIGTVRGDEKNALLQHAMFFACPKVLHNIGLANLEALAAGLPVVTGMADGVSDAIRNGENGFRVAPDNVEEMAEKLDLLLSDSALRKKMAKNARVSAMRYDWAVIAREYMDIYNKLL